MTLDASHFTSFALGPFALLLSRTASSYKSIFMSTEHALRTALPSCVKDKHHASSKTASKTAVLEKAVELPRT